MPSPFSIGVPRDTIRNIPHTGDTNSLDRCQSSLPAFLIYQPSSLTSFPPLPAQLPYESSSLTSLAPSPVFLPYQPSSPTSLPPLSAYLHYQSSSPTSLAPLLVFLPDQPSSPTSLPPLPTSLAPLPVFLLLPGELDGAHRHTDRQTDTRTWRLTDQLGPVGPSW